jgi:hypothetical protein
VDPSPKPSENVLEILCAVELAFGSYKLCPEQLESQLGEGKKRSLLPVSKSTVSCRGSVNDFKSPYRKVIPVKDLGGVPTEMAPNHNRALSSVNGSPPLARRESWILPERGCGTPVFLLYVANPSWIFLSVMGKSARLSAKLGSTYATERLTLLCNLEGSMTPSLGLPRLVIGTAIPREEGTLNDGAATVRRGSEARMKPRQKYISSSALKGLVGAC